jgi:hypothetical protein
MMKIILSPAKKMKVDTDSYEIQGMPVFLEQTESILRWLQSRSHDELKKLWKCNDKIAEQNFKRLEQMQLYKNLTPAILSYEDTFITVNFGEVDKGRFVTKATYAKMARGEMVRYMAENKIENPEKIKEFDRLGYVFREDMSDRTSFVFERTGESILT